MPMHYRTESDDDLDAGCEDLISLNQAASFTVEFDLTDEQVDAFADMLADPEWPNVIE